SLQELENWNELMQLDPIISKQKGFIHFLRKIEYRKAYIYYEKRNFQLFYHSVRRLEISMLLLKLVFKIIIPKPFSKYIKSMSQYNKLMQRYF
ncbi:uncharacterized protein METZ01_LOCUS497359, partial [marine metagenome]